MYVLRAHYVGDTNRLLERIENETGKRNIMKFTMKAEKGDKKLAVILHSGIRRWFRCLGLLGIGIAIVFLGWSDRGGNNASPSLRSVSEKRFRNVALRPPEDRTDADEWSRLTRDQMQEKCDYDKKKRSDGFTMPIRGLV